MGRYIPDARGRIGGGKSSTREYAAWEDVVVEEWLYLLSREGGGRCERLERGGNVQGESRARAPHGAPAAFVFSCGARARARVRLL